MNNLNLFTVLKKYGVYGKSILFWEAAVNKPMLRDTAYEKSK